MIRRVAVAALLLLAAPARAEDTPEEPDAATPADRIAAVAATGDGLDEIVLVGPSGQVYEPDGATGWVRRRPGGVAADVTGAAVVDGEVVVAGRATPLYRRAGDLWFALRIGQTGKTTIASGPAIAVAIGKQVFVHGKKGWTRVGALPARATHLWAAGPSAVWATTDVGLYRLKGKAFAKAGPAPRELVGSGKAPWALGDDGLTDLATGKTVPAQLDGADVAIAAAATPAGGRGGLHVVAEAGGGLVLARVDGGALVKIDDVPVTGGVAALRIGGDGEALVVMADGTVARRKGDGGWTTATAKDDLPARKSGAGPARTR